ncbi:MAG: hypothetical protein JXA90_12800 [Planctomycetes bacterium]|nr:hypothetical protein [Planctomycetota bacterium]
MRSPRAPRGEGDLSGERAVARALKAAGIVLDRAPKGLDAEREAPIPRIRVGRPRRGFRHAVRRSEIAAALRFFGETSIYGIREIVLASCADPDDPLRLGTLLVPGRILIYPVPRSPWRLRGSLAPDAVRRLERAGAVVERHGGGLQTTVEWPGDTLRDFVLLDVLMHEVGHHLIQQYKGKRGVRVARTRDHEAFADRFAESCRAAYEAARAREP